MGRIAGTGHFNPTFRTWTGVLAHSRYLRATLEPFTSHHSECMQLQLFTETVSELNRYQMLDRTSTSLPLNARSCRRAITMMQSRLVRGKPAALRLVNASARQCST
jgi:hypothetical protein